MDVLSLPGAADSLEIVDGGPLPAGLSGGTDNGGLGNGSSGILRSAAAGLSEIVSGAENLQGHGDSLASNEPTTTEANSIAVSSLAAGHSGQPNAESENVVVVGLHALNSTGVDDVHEELAVPEEEAWAQEDANPDGGEDVPPSGTIFTLSGGTSDVPLGEPAAAVQFEVVRQGQGEPNSGGGENIAVARNGEDDVRQDAERAVSVGVRDNDDHKRPHEEAANEAVDDSLVCPICMEPWTNSGEHRICCLACGHLFGRSCIRRWLRQAGRKSRCPHCNKRAKLEELRNLYVPRTLAVIDGEAQQCAQEVRALRAENLLLKSEKEQLLQEVLQSKARNGLVQASALQSLAVNSASTDFLQGAEYNTSWSELGQHLGNTRSSLVGHTARQAFDSRSRSAIPCFRQDHLDTGGGSGGYGQVSEAAPISSSSRAEETDSCRGSFQLQSVVPVHGGKVFDMDAESLTVIYSNKTEGSGFGLSKMSLLSSREIERIHYPSGFGTLRDIRLSPSGIGGTGKCAVVASTGKKLSLISLDTNNIVLTYSVESPPWSCAWDPIVPNLFYSGLQNGCLLLLDLRQTSSPVAMLSGPSNRPIHTLQVVQGHSHAQATMGSQPWGGREILSASNSGISLWNVGYSVAQSEMAKPQCVFSDRELVCSSLVYECSANTAVASFRRSPSAQTEPSSSSYGPSAGQNASQPVDGLFNSRPSPAAVGWEEPSHWIFNRSQGSSWSGDSRLPWEKVGAMVGNKSQSLMTRAAIISKSTPRSKSLFACGDEGTNSVWLWDMKSSRLADTLVPHQSPVLDVKNVQIQGKDMLGCVSEGTFQIYRRI